MMKKNVILIETLDSAGTGILYPCNYEDAKNRFQNYFIVFTNSHVLKDVGRFTEPDQNVKDLVKVQIFDDTGQRIEDENIQEIRIYNPGWDYEKQNDIAALLIAIHGQVSLTLETNIYTNELENRAILYMEGYPGIMLNDEVSQKLQLEGMSKSIFPESDKIGVYQITDDYHWYNGLQDRQLLSGLSGSPVYIERNGRGMLVGMNQSISDIARGENPFKLVYYLKMKYVLDCLREAGCILYQRVDEYTYRLEWIYGKTIDINNYDNNPVFLLIGGSGAGKSSFATDFAYHGDKLLATNDGQTTRTNVIYEYSIFEKEPRAVVQFMQKKMFTDRMLKLKGAGGILFLFRSLFGLSEEICKDEYKFLEDCSELLVGIKKRDVNGNDTISIRDFLEDKDARKDKESLVDWYESLLERILERIPFLLVRFVCDKEWVERCRKDYQDSYEKHFQMDNGEQGDNFWKEYILKDIKKQYKGMEGEVQCERIVELMKETSIFGILMKYCKQQSKSSFDAYLRECCEACKTYIAGGHNACKRENYITYEQKIFTVEFKMKYIKHLLFCEGFFDITEFSFLKDSQDIQKELEESAGEILVIKNARNVYDNTSSAVVDFGIIEGMKSVYNRCHEILIEAMMTNKVGIRENHYEITIMLKQMEEAERKLLQRCLQVTDGESLTGMVLSVRIKDMVSNPYAMELNNLRIRQLNIVDTHGLDHIQGEWSMEDALYDIVYTCQEQKIQLQNINVLYLKKLDSGKPDELRNILPMIYKVIPQAPVYCIFTGIDIFYQTPEEIRSIRWGRIDDKNVPKAVRYILSSKGRQEMMKNVQGTPERQRNMYLVLKNNLVPYCGKQELIQKKYVYYKNNVMYVRKLLASIVMKEYSSLEIISLDNYDDKLEKSREKVEKLIRLIFQRASINANWIHHQTLKADLRSVGEREQLGYWRTYRHQWNQRFHEAYAEVITKMGGELAQCYDNAQGAFEAAMSNMEDRFLGDSEQLRNRDLRDKDKSEFRLYLEEMFDQKKDGKAIYERNPFKENFTGQELSQMGSEGRKEIYRDFFDFAKGLDSQTMLDKFTEKFIKDLKKQIELDNSLKAENVIMLNHDFVAALKRLEDIFAEKYDIEETENTMNFYSIMQYYFRDKNRKTENW